MNFLDAYVEKKQLETIINNIEISCLAKQVCIVTSVSLNSNSFLAQKMDYLVPSVQ